MTAGILLVVGFFIGGVSGALGIGGGILLVPLLMWLGGGHQLKAQGITLAVLAVPVVLPGVWQYYTHKHLELKDFATAGWIAAGFAVGTYSGAWVSAAWLRDYVWLLRLLFGVMLIYVAIRFILGSDQEVAAAFLGLLATGFALISYLFLQMLGRKHLSKPSLAANIQAQHEIHPDEPDYYI